MNLAAQISLITVPQEFTRLCNIVLTAEHGADFLPIDDDRPDRGNDGYLKSERRLFAMHCFKRVQNQSLDNEIRSKMLSDLSKAVKLKEEGAWEIEAWTFICNYPIPEGVGRDVMLAAKRAGLEPSWLGPEYLATVLQKAKEARSLFPNLQVNEVMDQLQLIAAKLEASKFDETKEPINWIPRNLAEQEELVTQKPAGWEYLLFAGVLQMGKQELELKWHDYITGYSRRRGVYLAEEDIHTYIRGLFNDALTIMEPIEPSFSEESQLRMFGPPGESGNSDLIEHYAKRILASYEGLLDWAAEIRGTVYPEKYKRLFEYTALLAERPASDVRRFIDHAVEEIGKIPALLDNSDSGPIVIELPLTVTIDDAALDRWRVELNRLL